MRGNLGCSHGLGIGFLDSMEDIERAYEAWDIASDIINRFKEELQRQFGFDRDYMLDSCPCWCREDIGNQRRASLNDL